VATEPHNVPLQFLSETGIVGFLLYLGVAAGALWGAARTRGPLAIALGVFLLHTVVDMDWNFVATCGPFLLVAGALLARPAPERVRSRRPLLAAGAVLLAAAVVYSLAAPWLARRELAAAHPKQAHAYDPLSTQALIDWAAFEDAGGNVLHAVQLYEDAVSLEPQSSETWFALGLFYRDHGAWKRAYDAFSKAWSYNKFGPAGIPCGELDQARHHVTGKWPPSCPGGRPASNPASAPG
jgi:tetratricopeptide (TPR) repeat protein